MLSQSDAVSPRMDDPPSGSEDEPPEHGASRVLRTRSRPPSRVGFYPMSVRQQLAIIKQMDQPSPSGSLDGDCNASSSSSTPRRNISRVHKKNNRGETPLHGFAKKGDANKCYELICEGADVNCADYAGWTPLHEACSHHGFEAARVLIAHGAQVNVASDDGDTPLHDAAESSDYKITWLLLKHGANREARNKDGHRPADLTEDEKVLELLQTEAVSEECPSEDAKTTTAADKKKGTEPPLLPSSMASSGSSEEANAVSSLSPMAPELSSLTIDTAMDAFTAPMDSAPLQSNRSILSVASLQLPGTSMESGGGGLDLSDESESLDSAESIENNTGNTSPQVSSPHSNLRIDHLSPSPERRGKSSEPELQRRTAVWRTDRSESHSRAVSPHHTYDFVEDPEDSREEARSESGFGKKRGGRAGRGRGAKANSGTATPLVKKAARGARGGRRGRGYATRVSDMTETASGTTEDVYDFRGTPDSEIDERVDDREASLGPSSKRFRPNDDADSVTGTADIDDEPEEDEASRSSTRKVPILRISLAGTSAKQPSEEDMDTTPYRSKHLGRGRTGGKKGAEQDDDKRITRSKVRQSGRGLGDDGDSWPKKKRRAQTVDPQLDLDDHLDEMSLLRPVPEEPEYVPNLESLPEGQKILYEKPHKGILSMRKMVMSRWHEDLATDKTNANLTKDTNKESQTMEPVKWEAVTPGEMPHCLAGDPEGAELWRRQEEDRVDKLKEFNVRRVRLRLCYNEEFKRMEQRRNGTAPRMSAIRVFREDQICNPMIFDETLELPKPLPREEFDERVRKGVKKLCREEVMDTETIRGLQRGEWQELWRRRGFAGSEALLSKLVPTLPSEELVITFPSATSNS